MHTPHTSKLIVSLAFGIAAAHAGSVGVNVGANAGAGINGIAGSVGGSAALRGPVFSSSASATAMSAGSAAMIVGTSSASLGLARAGAALGAASNGVVFPDVVVDKSDYETIGMREQRAQTNASSAAGRTADASVGRADATVATDDQATVQKADAANARLITSDQIRSAKLESHAQVAGTVAATLADDSKFLARAKHDQRSWTQARRAEFTVAAKDTAAQAKRVRKDLKTLDRASERDWTDARAQLATDYAAYLEASDRARAVASAGATSSTQTTAAANPRAAKSNIEAAAESSSSADARL